MCSFQAKIGWKRQIRRENKNFRFAPFVPDCVKKIPKKQQKISKYDYGIISSQNWLEKTVKERK